LEEQLLSALTIGVMLVVSGLFLLAPRVARRGLLFGVYVGEEVAAGERARRLASAWARSILTWTILGLGLYAVVARRGSALSAYVAGLLCLLFGYIVQYVRSYRAALAMAPASPPPFAAAYLAPSPRPVMAYVALGTSVIAGTAALGYTWIHVAELPAQLPVHFGLSGRPDAYRPASLGTIWMLPLLTLVMGVALSGTAVLVAHAKRAVRRGDEGRSLAAQERFRGATSAFLALAALVTSLQLFVLSVGSLRVATGAADALPPLVPVLTVLLLGLAVGGSGFLALRYGQGGARLEAPGGAPLTNGLADNRRWALGMFYFDPQDPSIFVEKRFGIGYTLNFGNWKAVVGLLLFLLLIVLGPLLLD